MAKDVSKLKIVNDNTEYLFKDLLARNNISSLLGSGVLTSLTLNTFFAAPSNKDGVPLFRKITASDLPVLNQDTTGIASYAKYLRGRSSDGTYYGSSATDNIIAEWNTKSDNRWYLKAVKTYECRVDYATTAEKVKGTLKFGSKSFNGSLDVVLLGSDLGSVDLTSELTIIGLKTFSGETYLDSLNANTGLISGNLRVVNGIFGNLNGNVTGNLSGNASTATTLQTARTLTIGNTGKYFDGSSNISWTLSEIGAASSSHTHNYLPLSGGTMTGQIIGNNNGGGWIYGRLYAALYQKRNNENDWHPVVGFKTITGSWEFGSVGDNDFATFSWGSDSDFNSGNNSTTVVNLRNIGGTIALTSDIPTSLPANGGNADTVDNYHVSNLTKFYLSPLESSAPASSAKSWFINTMPSGAGAIVYNVPGSEKTIIVGKSTGSYGHMLQLNYDDTYLRILRYAGSWKSDDWEKISAGYADSAAIATNVAWSGVTNKPNFVNSFGTKTGDITIRGGQTGNGSVNLVMSNNELLASIVGLGSNAYTSTAYLPLTGGIMSLGEGLKFHADDNYFGTNLDARIISLLDGNGATCDGGLIIDERATHNGVEYVTELLRIRDSEFKWKGNDIYHKGNLSPMTTSHPANNITKTNIDNWNAVHTWYTTATASDTTDTIDTWKEIEAFVSSFNKGDNLASYLANNYLAKSGGTITGSIICNHDVYNKACYTWRNLRQNDNGGGRADLFIFLQKADGSYNAGFGTYGDNTTDRYIYAGYNEYYGLNLRISATSLSWGDDTILHTGNSSVSGNTISINGTSTTWTDTKVTQIISTSNNTDYRPVILGDSSNGSTNSFSTTTSSVLAAVNVYIKPNNGNLYTKGSLNASTTVTAGTSVSAGTTVTAATSITSTAGDFYVGGASGSRCHIKMDTTNKCIKFIFD